MPSTLFENGAHAFVEFTLNGVPNKGWAWDFKRLTDGEVTAGDLALIGDEIFALLDGTLKTYLGNSLTFTRIQLRALDVEIPPVLDYVSGLPITCSGSSAVSTGQVSICYKKSTNLGGRAYRGRIYVPAIPEGSLDSANMVSDAFVSNTLAAFNQFKDDIITNINWAWCVRHGNSEGVPLVIGTLTQIAEIIAVDKKVDTQRKRLK